MARSEVRGHPSDTSRLRALSWLVPSGGLTVIMFLSSLSLSLSLSSLLSLTSLALSLHHTDVWIGEMDSRQPKPSNRIETFVFPTKKEMYDIKDLGSSARQQVFEPLYFKFRNKFSGGTYGGQTQDRALQMKGGYVSQGTEGV